MMRILSIFALLAGVVLAPAALAGDSPFRFGASNLPRGWRVVKVIEVPKAQLSAFAGRLGAPVDALENQVLDVAGLATQWNVISAKDEAGAKRIEQTMVGMRGKDFVQRSGRHVYEIPGNNVLLARAVFAAAGREESEPVTYDVTFRTALVDEPDYALVNPVFNHFLKLDAGQIDEAAARRRVERDTAGWTFGNTLRLRAPSTPVFVVDWTFEPTPIAERRVGESMVYTFGDVPKRLGVPYVDVRGRIQVRSRFQPVGPKALEGPLEDAARWPAAPVSALAAGAVAGVEDDRQRALALLAALHSRVGYGGAMGSRDPVPEVLARGHGRCWDKSDVYIAMCRSVGLPARQVAGWVPALGAGHVWTEVYLEGAGWIPVDATTPWLGTGTDYIPFFLSENGRMPFLYLAMPQMKRREGP